ncbi:MAG: hypothetical protein M3Z24_01010, partial [Chloroflexota bacterium]|nr:hypothetical protein [Chloroflexota bacterium]
QNAAINLLTFDSDAHQLWAATSMGVYRSDNQGQTWRALNNGIPSASAIYTVQVMSSSGGAQGIVFAGTDHGFFYSNDAGSHWIRSDILSKLSIYAILVDFRRSTTIYIGTSLGAFRSDDNGKSWGGIAAGLSKNQPVYALQLGANDYSQLLAATNDVYLFPGTTGGFTAVRLLPLLFVALFFFLLYFMIMRSRKRRNTLLKPERIVEHPAAQGKKEHH